MTTGKHLSRRDVLAAATGSVAGLAAPWVIGAARAAGALKIGHLTDVSGPYSANSGRGVDCLCASGDRGFQSGVQGHGGRVSGGRSPEQHRHRAQHRAGMVRPRRRGRGAGGEQQRHRAGAEQSLHPEGQGAPELRRGDGGPDRQVMLAEHGALDLRQLDAHARVVDGADQGWASRPGSMSRRTMHSACR